MATGTIAWAEVTLKDGYKYIYVGEDMDSGIIAYELLKYVEYSETLDIKVWLY